MPTPPAVTLEALQVLDAIERTGSYAAAATTLNKVPSAISYTVQKLEQDLGITLFQRQGRRSVLTIAGRHLVERGRELLSAASELAASTQQVATGWEPRLRIALDHVLEDDFLLAPLQQLYGLQPHLNVEITQEVLAGTWEALLEDRVDLIVGAVEGAPGHQGLRVVPWQTMDMVVVAAPHHQAAQLPGPLSHEQLTEFRSVIVHDSSRKLRAMNRGILNRNQAIHVASMTMKIAAHQQGIGVGTVPRHRVQAALDSGQLVELSMQHPATPATTYLAWKISHRGQALKWMVQQLQALSA